MLPILLALTVLLASLFPLPSILYNTLGIIVGHGLLPGPQRYLSWFVTYGPFVIVSWYILRSLNVSPFVEHLARGRQLAKIGLWLYMLYLVLALGSFILSAIPYGGGSVPKVLGLLLVAVHAFLFSGLFIALFKELPAAQRSTPEPNPTLNTDGKNRRTT